MTDIFHECTKCKNRRVSSIEITPQGIDVACEKCGLSYFMRYS